jgi:hypothetical protein
MSLAFPRYLVCIIVTRCCDLINYSLNSLDQLTTNKLIQIKTVLDEVFCDILNYQRLGKCYQSKTSR